MRYKIKLTAFFLVSILASLLIAAKHEEYNVYPAPDTIKTSPGGDGIIRVRFEIPADKHIYGNPKGPAIGKPTSITPQPADGITFGPARYPAAEKLVYDEGDYNMVYYDEADIFLPFRVAAGAAVGSREVTIDSESLVCDDASCVLQKKSFAATILIAADGPPGPTDPELLRGYEAAKAPPGAIDNLAEPAKQIEDDGAPPADNAGGGKVDEPGKESGADTIGKSNDESKSGETETVPTPAPEPAGGVEKSTAGNDFEKTEFDPRFLETAAAAGLLTAILLGFLAGFILNFMPCVLPVVSIKVMSLVKHAGSDRRELTILGLLFSAGILVSFLVLATLAAWFGYSWGGLFQDRLFLIAMTSIVFLLALSMFEVFSLNTPGIANAAAQQRANAYLDAFLKGLLATLLATPCSGPFLGGALAWALTQPPASIFMIFLSIGLGMAAPYLLLTLRPGLLKFVPKPGEWMRTFEQAMGFLLIFTVVYLVGILDINSKPPMFLFLVFLAIAAWQYGRFAAIHQPLSKRIASTIAAIIIVVGGYFFSFGYLYNEDEPAEMASIEFSLDRLYQNSRDGKVTVIKFTADWCPNCKLVEQISLYTEDVADAISDNGAELMIADITIDHPQAEALLEKLGGRSIPFLAVVPAGKNFNRPYCLRDIYDEEEVIEAIKKAVAESRADQRG